MASTKAPASTKVTVTSMTSTATTGRPAKRPAKLVKAGALAKVSERPTTSADEAPAGLRGTWIAPDALIAFSIPIPETLAWPQLSPAERVIALLALQGLSTAAIGERRNVTARTVAHQLDSVYRKLGVQSRGELAALAVSGNTGQKTRR